jgi:hypothetical protein
MNPQDRPVVGDMSNANENGYTTLEGLESHLRPGARCVVTHKSSRGLTCTTLKIIGRYDDSPLWRVEFAGPDSPPHYGQMAECFLERLVLDELADAVEDEGPIAGSSP